MAEAGAPGDLAGSVDQQSDRDFRFLAAHKHVARIVAREQPLRRIDRPDRPDDLGFDGRIDSPVLERVAAALFERRHGFAERAGFEDDRPVAAGVDLQFGHGRRELLSLRSSARPAPQEVTASGPDARVAFPLVLPLLDFRQRSRRAAVGTFDHRIAGSPFVTVAATRPSKVLLPTGRNFAGTCSSICLQRLAE